MSCGDGGIVVRLRRRGQARELVLRDRIGLDEAAAGKLVARVASDTAADHVVRLARPSIRSGFIPLPGGAPVLACRPLNQEAMAPLANWDLTMGDVELL